MTLNTKTFNDVITFIRDEFGKPDGFIGLHEPQFSGNEKKYLIETIDSTFVSSVGKFVDQFEQDIRSYTGAKYAIATVNGTSALHISLLLAGVQQGDLVITQPLTFVATCNAIKYLGADPLFVDVDLDTLGLSAKALEIFLKDQTASSSRGIVHKSTNRRISACVPMHTFGHPAHLHELVDVCKRFDIPLVEDAAESLGSFYDGKHTGTFGLFGSFSFNGNKTITCGGGGMIITNDEVLGKMAKHLTTQAKTPHPWDFIHDHVGFNYRMPNINAALGCAQMEILDQLIKSKRATAGRYKLFFGERRDLCFVDEPNNAQSNFWLNAIMFIDPSDKDLFLQATNAAKVMTRPAWRLMNKLPMFQGAVKGDLTNSEYIEQRLVNLPSSPRLHAGSNE